MERYNIDHRSNPKGNSDTFMKEFRKRREGQLKKRRREDNLKFQMDMIMNPNKFNTSPGTGEENPIFGDPYWNI